ncbi:MAG TPA: ribonuclease P protein component [Nevskiaceae bacterium]|nr:ribonuclease P protein component [Nevskiaceae bacterium]
MARFPRRARLCKPRDYDEAFKSSTRLRDRFFDVVVQPRAGEAARLGLAISRKALPRAVDRNHIKRLVRESFRARAASLPGADVVVMARAAAGTAEPMALRSGLDRLWDQVRERCRPS